MTNEEIIKDIKNERAAKRVLWLIDYTTAEDIQKLSKDVWHKLIDLCEQRWDELAAKHTVANERFMDVMDDSNSTKHIQTRRQNELIAASKRLNDLETFWNLVQKNSPNRNQ